jgi:hypothetical protein
MAYGFGLGTDVYLSMSSCADCAKGFMFVCMCYMLCVPKP